LATKSKHYNAASAPLPEAAQRKRVSANEDLNAFFVVGASTYTRLDRVLQTFCYFPPERLTHFTGIDIDRDNIAWCKENFPAARFETVSPRPPTPDRRGLSAKASPRPHRPLTFVRRLSGTLMLFSPSAQQQGLSFASRRG
jgi:hypothetical protein